MRERVKNSELKKNEQNEKSRRRRRTHQQNTMSGIALGAAARAVKKGDVKTVFFWCKVILAFLMPPLAVALELHSFDSISIAVMVVALILWLLGWLPGESLSFFTTQPCDNCVLCDLR